MWTLHTWQLFESLQALSGHKFVTLDTTTPECHYSKSRRGSGGIFANGLRSIQQCATGNVTITEGPVIDAVIEGMLRCYINRFDVYLTMCAPQSDVSSHFEFLFTKTDLGAVPAVFATLASHAGIRRQAEACSSRPHFFVTHSLAGGTGSGGGSAILHSLRDIYGSGSYVMALSVAPSPKGDVPCQAFNSVLAGTALQVWRIIYSIQAAWNLQHWRIG